jgi:hypothetical protein
MVPLRSVVAVLGALALTVALASPASAGRFEPDDQPDLLLLATLAERAHARAYRHQQRFDRLLVFAEGFKAVPRAWRRARDEAAGAVAEIRAYAEVARRASMIAESAPSDGVLDGLAALRRRLAIRSLADAAERLAVDADRRLAALDGRTVRWRKPPTSLPAKGSRARAVLGARASRAPDGSTLRRAARTAQLAAQAAAVALEAADGMRGVRDDQARRFTAFGDLTPDDVARAAEHARTAAILAGQAQELRHQLTDGDDPGARVRHAVEAASDLAELAGQWATAARARLQGQPGDRPPTLAPAEVTAGMPSFVPADRTALDQPDPAYPVAAPFARALLFEPEEPEVTAPPASVPFSLDPMDGPDPATPMPEPFRAFIDSLGGGGTPPAGVRPPAGPRTPWNGTGPAAPVLPTPSGPAPEAPRGPGEDGIEARVEAPWPWVAGGEPEPEAGGVELVTVPGGLSVSVQDLLP